MTYVCSERFERFPEAVREAAFSRSLQKVKLSTSDITETGLTDLCEVLNDSDCSITNLSLSKCTGEIDVGRICQAIVRNAKTKISNLNLSYLHIDDDQCDYVATLVEFNTSIVILSLNGNDFTEIGLEKIQEAFKKNKNLQDINLFSMDVLDFADKSIYTIVARNRNNNDLKNLLAENLTQDKGVRWGRSKLMVIGQGRAGKTSTVRSLLGQAFDANQDSTIGAELKKTETSAWKEEDFMTSNFNDAAAQVLLKAKNEHAEKFNKALKEFEEQKAKAQAAGEQKLFEDEENEEDTRNGGDVEAPQMVEMDIGIAQEVVVEGRGEAEEVVADENQRRGNLEIDQEPEIRQEFFERDDTQLVNETDVARRFGRKLLAKAFTNQKDEDPNKVTFTIWDYGGQEIFYTLHHLFLTKYGVYLIVFDMTELVEEKEGELTVNDEAVKYLKFWTNSVLLHAPSAPLLLVGTHLDRILPPRLAPPPKEKGIMQRLNVFKRRKPKASAEEITAYEEDFLNCVHKALIATVGVTKNENLIPFSRERCFFALDNYNNIGVNELRSSIQKSVLGKYYIEQEIPLRWVLACDFLIEDEDIRDNWHYVEQVKKWSREFGCTSENEVETFLKLFHELGVLIYLSQSESLRDRVVAEPQWVIDKIGLLIRDEDLHGIPSEIPNIMRKEWKRLRKDGLVSRDLLEYLWGWKRGKPKAVIRKLNKAARKGQEIIEREEELKEIEFMLDLMQNAMLLSKWSYVEDTSDQYFFVPCLVRKEFAKDPNVAQRKAMFDSNSNNQKKLLLDFSSFFLPTGVFQRLICLMCDLLTGKVGSRFEGKEKKDRKNLMRAFKPFIGKDFAFIKLPFISKAQTEEFGLVLLQEEGDSITVTIQKEVYAASFLEIILSLTQKLKEESMGSRLKMKIFVSGEGVEDQKEYTEAHKEGLKAFSCWFKKEKVIEETAARVMDLDGFLND